MIFNQMVRVIFATILSFLGCVGCTTVEVTRAPLVSSQQRAPKIDPDEAVALLTFAAVESSLETEAVGCVNQSIKAVHPGVRVIAADEFRRTVFPYRMPNDEGERAKYIDLMMAQPLLRERMQALRIRYLVLLHGKTQMVTTTHDVNGIAVMGAAALTVFMQWDRRTNLAASIFGVTESRPVADLRATAAGKPWVFSGNLLFTFGAPAFTETEACKSVGDAVGKYLRSEPIEP